MLHPDITVLSIEIGVFPPSGYATEYELWSTYYCYRNIRNTIFSLPLRADIMATKAYPFGVLSQEMAINNCLAVQAVVAADQGVEARGYQSCSYAFSLAAGGPEDGALP